MYHLDLFSGIGGFSLAARWVWGKDHNVVAFVEREDYCQKVLNKHWPDVPIFSDIKEFTYEQKGDTEESASRGTIDLLTGGFPCQPFSVAGKRRGKADDRYLWPEMFRIIQETKPRWIIGENVSGFVNMGLDEAITDLEGEGYEVEALLIPACGIDAPHKRERCWIVAYAKGIYAQRRKDRQGQGQLRRSSAWARKQDVANPFNERSQGGLYGQPRQSWWPVEPDVDRVVNGLSGRVDRLKGLGNAIVPQVAQMIMEAIKEIDKQY